MNVENLKSIIDFLLKRTARQQVEILNLREENERLMAKKMGKRDLINRVQYQLRS